MKSVIKRICLISVLWCAVFGIIGTPSVKASTGVVRLTGSETEFIEKNSDGSCVLVIIDARDFAGMHEQEYGRYMYDRFMMPDEVFVKSYMGYRLPREDMSYTRVEDALYVVKFEKPVEILIKNISDFQSFVSLSWDSYIERLDRRYFFELFSRLCKYHRECNHVSWTVSYT